MKIGGVKPVTMISILIVAVGVILLAVSIFLEDFVNIALPLVFIMLGSVFFLLVYAGSERWRLSSVLFIPGSFLCALGLILLMNALTGDTKSWAYAWLLLIVGLGLGAILASNGQAWKPWVTLTGWGMAVLGVTLFAVFGAIAGGLFIKIAAPLLIIVGGAAFYWLRLDRLLPEPLLRRLQSGTDAAADTAPATDPIPVELADPLSARELEVLRLVDEGLSNQQIAIRLSVAPSTVKTHINNLYSKLGVETRVQAIRRAHELNLIKQ